MVVVLLLLLIIINADIKALKDAPALLPWWLKPLYKITITNYNYTYSYNCVKKVSVITDYIHNHVLAPSAQIGCTTHLPQKYFQTSSIICWSGWKSSAKLYKTVIILKLYCSGQKQLWYKSICCNAVILQLCGPLLQQQQS